MRRFNTFRIPLWLAISAAFLSTTLPLAAAMVGLLYRQNSVIARDIADRAMTEASDAVALGLSSLMKPVVGLIGLSAEFAQAQGESLRDQSTLRFLKEELDSMPALQAVYFGFADDDFTEVIRVPEAGKGIKLNGMTPPAGARYVLG